MSNASEFEVVEETPAPSERASTSAIPKRKGRLPTVSAQASLEPQAAPPSKKSKIPTSNGTGSSTPRVDQAAFEALRAENEVLKRDLESATEQASKFQDDFNRLQNLRFTKPETTLANYLADWEERDRHLTEQNQALLAELPRLREFLQPGTLTILTREEADQRLISHKKEIQDLRREVEEQREKIEELSVTLSSAQLDLSEEVNRSSKLNAQLSKASTHQAANSTDSAKNEIIMAFYETITNFKVHHAKKVTSDEVGEITELRCDCTTFGHTLFFKLEFFQSPTQNEGELVDTVRFSPLGLDREKDQAYLDGLAYLKDTFTFVKDGGPYDKQMWELGVTVNKLMRAWSEDQEAEEEEVGEEAEEQVMEDVDEDADEGDVEVLSAGDETTTA